MAVLLVYLSLSKMRYTHCLVAPFVSMNGYRAWSHSQTKIK